MDAVRLYAGVVALRLLYVLREVSRARDGRRQDKEAWKAP